ncbi:MAG: MaoC family dehydratase N-terminal domain-containing protein [Planctomycetes bacterium]|nr:MaoC family dehydratase N-terminal domain-containing protein [Planctomycetota bacterium]
MATAPRGMTYEKFTVGQVLESGSRTIFDADIVNFAGISGDFNALHVDDEFAKQNEFGRRIAHGLLVQAVASGLAVQAWLDGTVVAFLSAETKFSAPTFPGDTIHVKLTVANKRETKKPGRGIVFFEVEVVNQRAEKVMEGKWTMMLVKDVKPA